MLLKIMDTPQQIDGKVLLHASEALKAVSSDEECKKAIIAFKYFRVTREIGKMRDTFKSLITVNHN